MELGKLGAVVGGLHAREQRGRTRLLSLGRGNSGLRRSLSERRGIRGRLTVLSRGLRSGARGCRVTIRLLGRLRRGESRLGRHVRDVCARKGDTVRSSCGGVSYLTTCYCLGSITCRRVRQVGTLDGISPRLTGALFSKSLLRSVTRSNRSLVGRSIDFFTNVLGSTDSMTRKINNNDNTSGND